MLKDMQLWTDVRHALFVENISLREAAKRFHLNFRTVKKISEHESPPEYVRRTPAKRIKLQNFLPFVEGYLVYAKNVGQFKKYRNRVPFSVEQAKVYKNPDNNPNGRWRGIPMTAQGWRPNQMYKITTPTGVVHTPPEGRCWSMIESEFLKLKEAGRIWFGKDGNSQPSVIRFLSEVEGIVPWTWWPHEDVGHTDEAKKETHALFGKENAFGTPKPERLIQRVLEIATNPGDLVLDSFAGSGTTGAVAHKMGRRWIMVELGEHCQTHIVPRMKKVIDGDDPGGVTQETGWEGGGGFRYYRLAPSLLKLDHHGFWIINKEYNAAMLAEALCKIEGYTYEPSDTVYDAGLKPPKEKAEDIREVVNYRSAMNFASRQLQTRSLSLGFIREMHQMLMDGVRGDDKSPGQFRTKQNYIGRPGCTIEDATFVPPDPIRVPGDLEAWERYILGDDIEILIQCAVMHAQFELIHPFNDGNGRIGRLLIPLFLHQKRKISRPAFYISAFLEKNRDGYYDRLRGISRNNDWNGWIEFFLRAVSVQARNNCETVKAILGLYDEMKTIIQEATHSCYSIQVLDAIFSLPLFQSSEFHAKTGLAKNTANSLLTQLKQAGIIQEVLPGSGRKPAILTFQRLLEITEGRQFNFNQEK